MAEYTQFAGLFKLDPGDPVSLNNYEFYENEEVIDNYINSFLTHRHDGHPAMSGFGSTPTVTPSASGGTLAPGEVWYIGITAVDAYGGETAAQIASATTPGTVNNPTQTPVGAGGTGGSLNKGTYRYAYTVFDAIGETEISPQVNVSVPANGKATLTNLPNVSPNSKRIYRAFGFGDFVKVADISGATTSFVDDGTLCLSCDQQPPDENTAGATNSLRIARPALPASAAYWRVYASPEPDLTSPASWWGYSGQRDIASAASAIVFSTENDLKVGTPPLVSRTIPGASLIYATDVLYDGSSNLSSGTVEATLDSIGDALAGIRGTTLKVSGSASAVWGPLTLNASGNLSMSQSLASGASATMLFRVGTTAYGSAGKLQGNGKLDYYFPNLRDLEFRTTANAAASASAVSIVQRRSFNFASGNITLNLDNQETIMASASAAVVMSVTLPSASTNYSGWDYTIKNVGVSLMVQVLPSGGQRFEGGSAGLLLGAYEAFTVSYVPSGLASGWWIV